MIGDMYFHYFALEAFYLKHHEFFLCYINLKKILRFLILAFGKSKLLRLISHGLHVISGNFEHKFKSCSGGTNNNFPVYNDASCAGIIAAVNGCTRVLISEEADIFLPSIGAVLPSPLMNKDIPAVKSEARVEMMKMFDGDFHMRKLKGSTCKIDSFKHSFIVSISSFATLVHILFV